jgi:exodeoxyribonuclease VII large subunit
VRLDHGEARLQALRPAVLIAAQRRGLHDRAERLSAAVRRRMPDPRSHARISAAIDTSVRRRVRALRARLAAAQRVLDLTDPASILDRGFSITTDMQGRVLRNAADVAAGDRIVTRLAHGEVASRVDPPPRSK